MDNLTLEERRRCMRSVRRTRTRDEERVAAILDGLGLSYAWGTTRLPGTPDFVLARRRTAVFVHGCFWHGHDCARGARVPKQNRDYWLGKVGRNRERDAASRAALEADGWRVETVWECELKDAHSLTARLEQLLAG